MRPMPFDNKRWPDVRLLLQNKEEGYYIERDGWYDIVMPDALVQCQIPTTATFDEMPADMATYFNRKHCEDFEQNHKPQMLRSTLSR